MLNTENVPITAVAERKIVKVDVRSVIIVGILAFGVGAYSGQGEPSYGTTPPGATTATTAPASPGK
jgi:hypothetical protein